VNAKKRTGNWKKEGKTEIRFSYVRHLSGHVTIIQHASRVSVPVMYSGVSLLHSTLSPASHVYRLHPSSILCSRTSISTALLYIRWFPNGTW